MSPQDDHVIEFARQFGWNPEWMDKAPKKRGKKQLQQEAATRASGDIGEMLTTQVAQSHVPSSHESQVVSREDTPQVPQVKAAPPPPAPSSAPLLRLCGCSWCHSCTTSSPTQQTQGKVGGVSVM